MIERMSAVIFLKAIYKLVSHCLPVLATFKCMHDPSSHNPVLKLAGSQRMSPSHLKTHFSSVTLKTHGWEVHAPHKSPK